MISFFVAAALALSIVGMTVVLVVISCLLFACMIATVVPTERNDDGD